MPFAAELYEAGARIGLWNITESEAALRTGANCWRYAP